MLLSLHSSCYVTTVKSWTDLSLILKRGKLHWVVCKNISGTQTNRHITQASIRIECRVSCLPQNHHLVCESHRLIYAQYPGYVTRQEFTVMISGSDATGRKPGLLTLVSLQTLLMVSESESPGPEGARLLHSQASLLLLLRVPLIHWMPVPFVFACMIKTVFKIFHTMQFLA